MLRILTRWYEETEEYVKRAAYSKHAWTTLFVVSYLENFLSPIPGDVLVAPLAAEHPRRKWFIVLFATGASVLGALTGYIIGHFLFQSIGQELVRLYGGEDSFALFQSVFEKYGFATLFVVAFTPLPDKVFTVLSGVAAISLLPFTIAMALGRGLRFYIVAYLAATYGKSAYTFFKQKFGVATFVFAGVLVLVLIFSYFTVQ